MLRFITSNKKIQKELYLSHKVKEKFVRETVPSFLSAVQSGWFQNRSFFDAWITQENTFSKSFEESSNSIQITWLGHASFLIRCGKTTIITDPVFESIPLFSRLTPHGIDLSSLPLIDVVLLSHNHRDHMDMHSLFCLAYRNPKTKFLVPHGDKRWFSKQHFPHVFEHSWYDQSIIHDPNNEINFTFLPAFHWSRRSLFDTNASLWGSWLIEWDNHTIYFGGDTAYFEHFSEIGSQYNISIALLPIAPIQPQEWMSRSHMNPSDAGKAFLDLNAKIFIPMHWGTFHFGIDRFQDPIQLLEQWKSENEKQLNTEQKSVKILKLGESLRAYP